LAVLSRFLAILGRKNGVFGPKLAVLGRFFKETDAGILGSRTLADKGKGSPENSDFEGFLGIFEVV
jgi:hypothetical protein